MGTIKSGKNPKIQWCGEKLRMLILCIVTAGMLIGCAAAQDSETPKETAEGAVSQEATQEEKEQRKTLQDKRAQEESDTSDDMESKEEETKDESDAPVTMADLVGGNKSKQEQEEAPELPDTVLWFNATYAPLTYSNGWNWRLVGGLEPTEDNIELSKNLLRSSWSVKDRETALETVDSLIRKGHRGKCRECMEELEEWGVLDLDEEEFVQELLDRAPEGSPGRYVIAYEMYRGGIDPEYLAAWDLCRVNQLYADYYLCGYMDYEEAMDASLENSLRLQELYDSWDEMVSAYMLGYQFWQGDLAITEDSPTLERYQYYEMLAGMQNGPYTLDWNMKLEKSW